MYGEEAGLSELDRVVSEAQHAREEAEAAARRAAELEAQAESARKRARQEEELQQRAWAQKIVDSYDADIGEADAAIQAAQERFKAVVANDPSGAVAAYLEWGQTTMRHYVLQLRVFDAAPLLGMEASPPEFIAPPLFSDALDQSLAERLGTLADQARAEVQSEISRLRD